jgi:hypothetical protein
VNLGTESGTIRDGVGVEPPTDRTLGPESPKPGKDGPHGDSGQVLKISRDGVPAGAVRKADRVEQVGSKLIGK